MILHEASTKFLPLIPCVFRCTRVWRGPNRFALSNLRLMRQFSTEGGPIGISSSSMDGSDSTWPTSGIKYRQCGRFSNANGNRSSANVAFVSSIPLPTASRLTRCASTWVLKRLRPDRASGKKVRPVWDDFTKANGATRFGSACSWRRSSSSPVVLSISALATVVVMDWLFIWPSILWPI